MGIIQRQGIKQSIVRYIGVAIGAVSIILIYPIDKEAYGVARFLIDTSLFFTAFITLGAGTVAIRFFEEFRKGEKQARGFLGFLLLMCTVGVLIFLACGFIFKESIFEYFGAKSEIFNTFLPYLIPLTLLMSYSSVLSNYSINSRRIVVPAIFQAFVKIALPILFLLLINEYISLKGLANGLVLNFVIVLIGLLLYLNYLGSFHWRVDFSFLTNQRLRRIGNFAYFGLLANIGSILAIRIDGIMIPTLIDFQNNGVYAIAAFIGNAMMIPGTALMLISSPIIAKAFQEDDLKQIESIYRKGSINLSMVGLFFLVCIVASVQDLFLLMPKSEELVGGFLVVVLLCIAKVLDLATSVNNQIINYSKHYRFGMYAVVFMGILNIIFNLLFIPRYGIVGAALATLTSLFLYNLIKLIFIYNKFKIQPFSKEILALLMLAAIAFLVGWIFPVTGTPIVDIIIRSLIISLIYLPPVIYFDLAPDITRLLKNGWQRIRNFF